MVSTASVSGVTGMPANSECIRLQISLSIRSCSYAKMREPCSSPAPSSISDRVESAMNEERALSTPACQSGCLAPVA